MAVFVGLGGPVRAERDAHGNERLATTSWRRAGLQTKGLRRTAGRTASDDDDGESPRSLGRPRRARSVAVGATTRALQPTIPPPHEPPTACGRRLVAVRGRCL